MIQNYQTSKRGAALITVLILASAIAIVVTGLFVILSRDVEVSGKNLHQVSAALGEKAALAAASTVLETLTVSDDYLVTVAIDQTASGPTRYTFLSQPSAGRLTHTPLFTGAVTETLPMPDISGPSRSDMLAQALAAPRLEFSDTETSAPIQVKPMHHISSTGALVKENPTPRLGLIDLPPTPDSNFRTRYAFWIEDLEGLPNLDALGMESRHYLDSTGNPDAIPIRPGYRELDTRIGARLTLHDQPDVSFAFPEAVRGQSLVNQIAPGLSPREIALLPWKTELLSIDQHPFASLPKRFETSRTIIPGTEDQRFSLGLLPYEVTPRIPYGHGYADQGKIRHNLNSLTRARDLSIVEIIERNLPRFEERKGGFPTDESYLSTLAANMIDYADEDGEPTVPANSINLPDARNFRGVDAYCPVNELFVKFSFIESVPGKASNKLVLSFEAEIFAELWNTSNQHTSEGHITLDFYFMAPLGISNPIILKDDPEVASNWVVLSEDDLVLNEPLDEGLLITATADTALRSEIMPLQPNEIRVVNFGTLQWEKEVTISPSSILTPEIFSVKVSQTPFPSTSGRISHHNPEANFDLFFNGHRVDSQGRTINWDRNSPTVGANHGFFFNSLTRSGLPMSIERGQRNAVIRVAMGNRRTRSGTETGSHLGDPWMNIYSQSKLDNFSFRLSEYVNHSSPGFRNIGYDFLGNRNGQQDIIPDQVRVRDWPDGGYDNALNQSATDNEFNSEPPTLVPRSQDEIPSGFFFPTDRARAPWRLSQKGRFFSLTELGHLHDPVMWYLVDPGTSATKQRFGEFRDKQLKSLPKDITPAAFWGGGNTLRIGRPEHELFDEPGKRASQLLDLFQVGETGTNLKSISGTDEIYRFYDPRDHHPPRTADNAHDATLKPYTFVYRPTMHAEGTTRRVYGHLNLNTVPTTMEIEALLRGPLVSNHLMVIPETTEALTPLYEDEMKTETLKKTLSTNAVPKIAREIYRLRPFYSPSHLARVFTYLLDEHDALPEHINDAEAEESFARLYNLTTLSSRHFRIYTYAETYHISTGSITARESSCYDVFMGRDETRPSLVKTQILTKRSL